jgi:ATP-dependent RNA helicase DDX5/DBP2
MPSSGQFPRNGGTSSFRNFGESRFSDKPDFSGLNDINNILPPVSFENAPPFRKNFYNPPAQPKTKDENERILSKFEITTSGRDANSYQPIENFSDIGFPEYINSELQRQGFTHPTGIQAAAFPIAMSGRNIIGIAKTGSGKTLSYLIPALIHLNDQKTTGWKAEGPIALVLAPTRELAQQIQSVANEFGTRNNITNACIFGGAPKSGQTRQLSRNVDIVIATPGRLIDFLQRDVTNLKRCTYLVLDEADRELNFLISNFLDDLIIVILNVLGMLDMGFLPQIKKIMSQIRPDRQVLMFSATWPKEMQLLARDYITDYVQLNIGTTNYAANNNIQQIVDICEENEKDEKLMRILSDISNQNSRKTIIFVETKRRADEITKSVNKRGFNAVSIHGDKSQAERELSLSSFRHGRMRVEILVATDVASRGLGE